MAAARTSTDAEITMALLGGQGGDHQQEAKLDGGSLSKSDQFLNQGFLFTTTRVFRDACTMAGYKARANEGFPDLMEQYLRPITEYMADLKIENNKVAGRTKQDRTINGLLDLIADKKETFVRDNHQLLSWYGMKKMKQGFDRILKQTKEYVRSAHGEFLDEHNRPGIEAQLAIRNARLKKTYDFCCLTACVVWVIPECLLTCCNGLGCGSRMGTYGAEPTCVNECARKPQDGNIHVFAPIGSMFSLANNWSEQNKIIDDNKPAAMRMI